MENKENNQFFRKKKYKRNVLSIKYKTIIKK